MTNKCFRIFLVLFFSISNNILCQQQPDLIKGPLNESREYVETIQKATFNYFWDFSHPVSGMAPERSATPNIVTTGGSGFGIMCIVVGSYREWITREDAVKHLLKTTAFLAKADRFHGVWPHWIDGRNGKVIPFGEKDNGGDLVETSYLINGLLVARNYFNNNQPDEIKLRKQITDLWETVEWDWYASRGDGFLYWHWSPNYSWAMNMPIRGYNECLITYVLALGSPTHPIKTEVYQKTWKNSNFYNNGKQYFGHTLSLGFPYGGPLFFSHYSFLSLDPRLMEDEKTNYWKQNVNHTLINYQYCISEASKSFGYTNENWGLTASDDYNFYDAHSPTNDNGTLSPTAALSSFPYTPFASYQSMKFFYFKRGNSLFGKYGFYDAYNATKNWYSNQYLAIDQGPIVIMIENYRSGLLWKIGENITELKNGLKAMEIHRPSYPTGFYMYFPEMSSGEYDLMKHTDKGKYVIDFAVSGKDPIKLDLIDKDGKLINLFDRKNFIEGTHEFLFDAGIGKYQAIITQSSNQHKIILNLK